MEVIDRCAECGKRIKTDSKVLFFLGKRHCLTCYKRHVEDSIDIIIEWPENKGKTREDLRKEIDIVQQENGAY
jgi:hypothetical protein